MDYTTILSELQTRWNVQEDGTWTPICGEINTPGVLVHKAGILEYKLKAILKNVFNIDSILEINENREAKETKIDKINFVYDGIEHFYTDISYNFLIYVSHENTITVGSDRINQFIITFFALEETIKSTQNEIPSIIKDGQERAIAFRIGSYIKELIESKKEWTVDMEYNRVGDGNDPKISDYQKYILPDIIIHKRGNESFDGCFLIIEIKIYNTDTESDFSKLKEFTTETTQNSRRKIQYQFGLSISFLPEIRLVWFQNGKELNI